MAKTTTPPPEAPAALDEKGVAAMVERVATAVVEKIVEGIVDRERAKFKVWARREIALNACGATDDERGEMNR